MLKPSLGSTYTFGYKNSRPACHLLMNEGCGSLLKDMSGNSNPGTITGATWTPGRSGQCLSFNSTGTYATIWSGGKTLSRNSAAVSLWFRVTSFAADYQHFLGNLSSDTYKFIGLFGTRLQAESNTNSDLWMYKDGMVSTDVWYHLGLSAYNGTVQSYLNGVLIDTRTPANDMTLYSVSSPYSHYVGLLDNVMIFDTPLSYNQIFDLYQNPFQNMIRDEDAWL